MEESKNWDTTENLYIEGDNLDVLKLLQESYLGKVKMIYIDPPYNTGNDFVYRDNFTRDKDEYDEEAGVYNEDGDRLFRNTESNGRFHSDWCSMMYPRLVLARNLLRDDGVIFISIDDNEVAQLRKISDEVFGEGNFIAQISNTNNPKGRSDDKYVATAHEYVMIYAKSIIMLDWYGFEPTEEIIKRYNKVDTNGKRYREIDLRKTGENDLREDRPNLFYYFYFNEESGDFYPSKNDKAVDGYIQIKPQREDGKEGNWRWGMDTALNKISNLIPKFMPARKVWGVIEKDYLEKRTLIKPTSSWTFKDVNSERGSEEFISLGFDKRIFPKPKPIGTINRCLKLATSNDSIILDFFSGSATTAHAVMQLNAEDGGKRKFIMVQLPEPCSPESEAAKTGYKNICEIGKERIRRAGEKINSELRIRNAELREQDNSELRITNSELGGNSELRITNSELDIGFRVLKLDSTNMRDVYYAAGEYTQDLLSMMEDNIKDDRTDMDLLYACLLDWGLPLSMPHKTEVLNASGEIVANSELRIPNSELFTVHTYNDGDLIACFDKHISDAVVKEIAKRQPLRAVFRDSSFASSPEKINVEEIFKLLAPNTSVRVI
ncbi:MAG: site-specific DNA-methyltransferase [Desulforudis sp.]|nr:MAG: site-specific DNA-methyltransferase [Desulforudis sp.]